MEIARIAPERAGLWTPLRDTLIGPRLWNSPLLHFPLSESSWLALSSVPYLALFPLLDTSARLARGRQIRLRELVEKFRRWVEVAPDDAESYLSKGGADAHEENSPINLPDFDSYRMVRAGKWYQIVARDNFTCCACRRSAQKDGVVLHVDHIEPKSKGGSDDPSNLQTLCWKCNIGKLNKHSTSLTTAK
jgi:hypothetical protein